jgi:hypothetical protein
LQFSKQVLQCKDWELLTLHSSVQKETPTQQYLDDNILFAVGRELIIDVPINHRGYADIYINNTMGLAVNLPGTQNADKLEAAIPLTIKVPARQQDKNEPILHNPMVVRDKLKAKGGLPKMKIILGWHINFQTLTVTLPKHKYIAWSAEIQKIICTNKTTKQYLVLMIGQMGHISFVIPWVYHFLSSLHAPATGEQ